MFGYKIRKFAYNWVIVLLVLVIGSAAVLGYNSITGSFDLFTGLGTLGGMFGGLPSLGGLLLVLAAIAAVVYLLIHMTKSNYKDRQGAQALHIILIVGVIGAALFIGTEWINIQAGFWPMVGTIIVIVALVTGATALITDRTKKVQTIPVSTTTS